MKKLLMAFAGVLSVLGAFQVAKGQDVTFPTTSAYLTLARGNSWGSAGACGSGAGCGVNNVYVWSPPTPDSTVCVSVTNNNPTNAHPVTLVLQQTLDATVQNFSANTSFWAPVPIQGTTTFPTNILNASTATFFFKSSSAAKLALVVSGTGTLAGTPDTANIVVVQPSTASFCGNAANSTGFVSVIGAIGQGNAIPSVLQSPVLVGGWQESGGTVFNIAQHSTVDANTNGWIVGVNGAASEGAQIGQGAELNFPPGGGVALLQAQAVGQASDVGIGGGAGSNPGISRVSTKYGTASSDAFAWASSQAGTSGVPLATYNAQFDAVNPGAGFILNTVTTGAANGLTPHRAYIACSATCDVTINRVSTAGTTCTANTIVKTFDPTLGLASASTSNHGACVANPTVTYVIVHLWLAAGTSQTFDLSGYYTKVGAGAGNGFDVVEGAAVAAGTVSTTLDWAER